jgi:hypothetical protein
VLTLPNDAPVAVKLLDEIAALNQESYKNIGDPEIVTKIQQYELAYRMQMAVPEITSLQNEPESIVKMYGPECLIPGTYAANCLLARKLSENGVRFVQLYHQGWDTHGNLKNDMTMQAEDVDRASIFDLGQRKRGAKRGYVFGCHFGHV